MARLSMKLFVLAAVALVALSLIAGAHGQSYGGFAQNGGGEDYGEGGGGGNDKQQGGGGGNDKQQGGGGSGGGGGGSTDRGPIQFPPAPTSSDTSSVVIGGSGFGFVPPQAGGGRGFNFGSRYRGGSSIGGSSFGGGGGGYRSSFGGPRFGGFDGYRGFGGFGLRGVSGHGGFFNQW